MQNLSQAKALLRQQFELFEKTIIRAPMAGTVVSVSIKTGETAVPSAVGIPGSSLVTIANTRSIMIDLSVDESDIAHLGIGQPVEMHCPPLPNAVLLGHIRSIALAPRLNGIGSGDSFSARSYSVKADLDDPRAGVLRPGMDCRAEIFTTSPPASLSVPVQAIVKVRADDSDGLSGDNKPASARGPSYIFVDEDGYARRRTVQLGAANDSYQEIKEGLKPREQVILGPYRSLRALVDGDRITSYAEKDETL